MSRPVHVVLGSTGAVGGELCRRLVEGGARVIAAGRRPDAVETLASQLDAQPAVVEATDPHAVDALLSSVEAEHGRLDGVANCVGSLLLKPLHATTAEEWQEVLTVNLGSAFATVRAAGRQMRGAGGSVVLVSSAAARIGLPNHEAIAAAKGAIEGLALSAAASYAPKGLRFNVVAPGLVNSPASLEASRSMHALGRIGEPGDVAAAIAWLLDPAQSWVTGQVLGVDGGLSRVRART
jgi:NAD(P)-dependent dehydrogenase (short-subunit alcohol dehydrogenase family)